MSRDKFLLNCSEYCSAHVYIYTESDPFLNFQILVLLKHHGSQMLSNIRNNSMQLETKPIKILQLAHIDVFLCFKFWIRFQNYSQRKCVSLQESSSSNMYLINYANMLIWRANNVESVFDGFVLKNLWNCSCLSGSIYFLFTYIDLCITHWVFLGQFESKFIIFFVKLNWVIIKDKKDNNNK